jgi:LuxR family maltose regulon positive regulatory protein
MLAENARQWRATCLGTIGEEALLAGELDTARKTFLEAHACFEAAGNHYGRRMALLALAALCALQGKLRESAMLYQKVLDSAGDDLADQSQALLGLARLAYEWNEMDTAETQAREALSISALVGDEAHQIQAALILANIQHARGESALARQQFAALLARAQTNASSLLYREVLARQTHLQFVTGDTALARRWLTWQATQDIALPLLQEAREKLLTARLLGGQKQAAEALALLNTVRDNARRQGCVRDEIEALLLTALILQAQQGIELAWPALRDALALARGEGYTRLFLDEGEPVAVLLRAALPLDETRLLAGYMRTLLLAFSRQPSKPGALAEANRPPLPHTIEPLSPQEQRVLRLLAAGMSNDEIAETLVVSTNTVKTQVQSIYRKLNVHSRKEARPPPPPLLLMSVLMGRKAESTITLPIIIFG